MQRLRPIRRCAIVLAVALAGLAGARRACAAELTLEGPTACPDAAELTFRVERAIGMPLAQAAPLHVDVRFTAGAAAYSARLAVNDGGTAASGTERVLQASGCPELADAVAVAIALALGSSAGEGTVRAENAASSIQGRAVEAGAEPSPADVDAASSEPAIAGDPALSSALSMAFVADAGSLPGVGLGLGLGAELRVARSAVRASGTLLFDRHVTLPDAGVQSPGADMSLVLGSLSVCTSPFAGTASALFLCGGWELGRIEAVGTGVEQPRRGAAVWSAPRLDLGGSWAIDGSPLRPFGQLTAAMPLQRDDFYLRDLGTVHRAPAVVARLAIGLDVRF
jgi:hypothetical protein